MAERIKCGVTCKFYKQKKKMGKRKTPSIVSKLFKETEHRKYLRLKKMY